MNLLLETIKHSLGDMPVSGQGCPFAFDSGGPDIAIQAARNFRLLRRRGITVRKTIDTVIATRCIESGFRLLHSDRDFDPFVKHLVLRTVVARPRVN